MKKRQVIVVTGAQTGIGADIAIAFGRLGAQVVVNYLDDERAAQAVAQAVREGGGESVCVQADVASACDVERLFDMVRGRCGGIDALVNNAGIFPRKAFLDMTDEDWDFVLDVNLKGSFRCARAAAQMMVPAGNGGAIINVASSAVRGRKLGVHYTASKGGVIAMTKSMALELAPHGIRVNAVAPGTTDTAQPRVEHSEAALQAIEQQIPLGRMAQPDDIADVVVFLASHGSRFITGQTIYVNGGSYMP